jgi:hypothetical protein
MKDWLEMLSKRTHIRTPDEDSNISPSPDTVPQTKSVMMAMNIKMLTRARMRMTTSERNKDTASAGLSIDT